MIVWSLAGVLALASPSLAQQQQQPNQQNQQSQRQQQERQQEEKQQQQEQKNIAETQRAKKAGEQTKAETVFRVSKLSGMDVKNPNGQDLGEIKDLVIDVNSGKVVYGALSVGGVLGIGDKLFAVPWKAFTLKHSEDDQHLVLAVEKETFKTAKGFDQDHWPDVANQQWAAENDKFYETATKAAEQERTRR
jgi:sporulation protein YlmC with PRC-barrel domain